ncbi:MAG: hypothetical protein QOE29_28, partial [Gaiellaceae bacterium]|nr:hypothetical protein [Gaiellaceae bacterium]
MRMRPFPFVSTVASPQQVPAAVGVTTTMRVPSGDQEGCETGGKCVMSRRW